MKFLPNLQTFIQIGPFSITFYALFILTGAVIGYYFVRKKFIQMGYEPQIIEDFAFYVLPIAIVGARLWYVIFEYRQYIQQPIKIFFIHEGGLAIHGGLIVGIAFGYYYFKKRNISVLRMADTILPFVLLAQAIGRWGNFMNQEAYGRIVNEQFYQHFPKFIKDMMYIENAYREPTFLYESITNLLGFFLLYFVLRKLGRRKYGDVACGYLMYYGVTRFFIEALRSDSLMFFGLRTAQITSLVLILIGCIGYIKKSTIKPIISFDLDGTLLQSETLIMDSFKHTFETLLPDVEISTQTYRSFLGFPLEETFKKYDAVNYQKFIDTYRAFNLKHHDSYVQLYDGAFDLLKKLKEEGYTIAIVSSKKADLVKHALQLFEVNQFVDVVVGGDEVDKHKPDKEPLKKACDLLGKGHDRYIYIGDSVQDMLAAKHLGAYSIAVLFDEIRREDLLAVKADCYVNHLSEIYDIVKEERVWQNSLI